MLNVGKKNINNVNLYQLYVLEINRFHFNFLDLVKMTCQANLAFNISLVKAYYKSLELIYI